MLRMQKIKTAYRCAALVGTVGIMVLSGCKADGAAVSTGVVPSGVMDMAERTAPPVTVPPAPALAEEPPSVAEPEPVETPLLDLELIEPIENSKELEAPDAGAVSKTVPEISAAPVMPTKLPTPAPTVPVLSETTYATPLPVVTDLQPIQIIDTEPLPTQEVISIYTPSPIPQPTPAPTLPIEMPSAHSPASGYAYCSCGAVLSEHEYVAHMKQHALNGDSFHYDTY